MNESWILFYFHNIDLKIIVRSWRSLNLVYLNRLLRRPAIFWIFLIISRSCDKRRCRITMYTKIPTIIIPNSTPTSVNRMVISPITYSCRCNSSGKAKFSKISAILISKIDWVFSLQKFEINWRTNWIPKFIPIRLIPTPRYHKRSTHYHHPS